jgi:hypothetical protein
MVRRILLLLALTAPAIARADIPPDPDSADAHCSKAEQCPNGELCPYAFRPGDQSGESEKVGADCRAQVASKGLERRCRSGGNYSGESLHCPPGETGSWSPPGQPKPELKPEPKPEPKPELAKLETTKQGDTTPQPAKASMCSMTGGPGLLALLVLMRRRRRR